MSTEDHPATFDVSFAHAISPVTALASQALCVLAVYFAASHSLKRWIAVSSLQPPALEDKSAGKAETPPRKGWARVFNKDTAKGLIPLSIFASIQVLVLFVIPKIKSQKVINGIWLTLLGICLSATSDGVTRVIFPSQVSFKLVQTQNAKPSFMLKQETTRHGAWSFVPFFSAATAIASSYFGMQVAVPIMAFAWTMTCLAFASGPKMHLRYIIMVLNGYIMAVPIIIAIITGIVALSSSNSSSEDGTSKPKDPEENVMPSIWVFRLMLTFVLALPCAAPGMILTLAYRYDHSKSSSISQLSAGPGEAIVVPSSVPATSKPTFFAGLTALALSLLAVEVLNVTTLGLPNGLESIYIFVTIPITTLALVGSAWSRGHLREFWMYTEAWVPQVEHNPFVAKDDVEATPAVETEDEKQKLLHPSA